MNKQLEWAILSVNKNPVGRTMVLTYQQWALEMYWDEGCSAFSRAGRFRRSASQFIAWQRK